MREFKEEVWEDPWVLRNSPAVQGVLIGLGVAVVVVAGLGVLASMTPAAPGGAGEPAKTGTFQVQCTNPSCGHRWSMTADLDFANWPVKCERCGRMTGQRLVRCPNVSCGRWVVPRVLPNGERMCPECKMRW